MENLTAKRCIIVRRGKELRELSDAEHLDGEVKKEELESRLREKVATEDGVRE